MQTKEFAMRVVTSLLAGCLLILIADLSLAYISARSGWYYGIGVGVTAFMTFRVVPPLIELSYRWRSHRPRPNV